MNYCYGQTLETMVSTDSKFHCRAHCCAIKNLTVQGQRRRLPLFVSTNCNEKGFRWSRKPPAPQRPDSNTADSACVPRRGSQASQACYNATHTCRPTFHPSHVDVGLRGPGRDTSQSLSGGRALPGPRTRKQLPVKDCRGARRSARRRGDCPARSTGLRAAMDGRSGVMLTGGFTGKAGRNGALRAWLRPGYLKSIGGHGKVTAICCVLRTCWALAVLHIHVAKLEPAQAQVSDPPARNAPSLPE